MKKLSLSAIFCLVTFFSFSQSGKTYLKVSGGSVSFGSGDFMGYSFLLDASKDIIRKPSFGVSKLLLGGELIFENGVKKPVVENPTSDEFLQSFHHVSSTILWLKASYYPFKKIINGFNIVIGPTVGYSYRSGEAGVKLVTNILGESARMSKLAYNNGFTIGYRISTGFEFNITPKILAGIRLDFSNNNEAEINTLAGIKAGIRLKIVFLALVSCQRIRKEGDWNPLKTKTPAL